MPNYAYVARNHAGEETTGGVMEGLWQWVERFGIHSPDDEELTLAKLLFGLWICGQLPSA